MAGARYSPSSAGIWRNRKFVHVHVHHRDRTRARHGEARERMVPLSRAVVAYDHARHAQLGDVVTLDFINTDLDPGSRAGIELSLETAKGLRAALDRVIAAAEFEEAEVRGATVWSGPLLGADEVKRRQFPETAGGVEVLSAAE